MPGKQRKERESSITFFPHCHTPVFSSRLAPDVDPRGAEVLTHCVVAGVKIDDKVYFVTSPFFPAKNAVVSNPGKSQKNIDIIFLSRYFVLFIFFVTPSA